MYLLLFDVAQCPPLDDVENGNVSISLDTITNQHSATYTCNSGYEIVGSKIRICHPKADIATPDGSYAKRNTWSGKDLFCKKGRINGEEFINTHTHMCVNFMVCNS